MMDIRTILGKSRVLVTAFGLFIILAISLGLAVYGEASRQAQMRQAVVVQAQVLADSLSAALAFDDVETIREYTAAQHANPDIEAVAVYNQRGELVGLYGPAPTPADMQNGRADGQDPGNAIILPVVAKSLALGRVYVRQRAEPINLRIARYGGVFLLGAVAGLMLIVMARDARALAHGNERLTQEMSAREKTEAALRQSQKMEAVGRLTGGIAHDFNNMLAVMLGNNDLLLRRFPDADPKLLRFVQSSQEAGKRAATLTSRLLAFSRRQALDPKSVDVRKAISDTSELLRRTIGESIEIETVHAAGLWRAHIDVGQLDTALVNLAVNARDAMPQGGKLTIEASNADLDASYAANHDDVRPGQYVVIAVTDTGTGMTPDVVDMVFEPFFTTKPVGQGTGLGLSQVHGFMKQSGGHVTIYSEVDHGTTIKLYLPRSLDGDVSTSPEVVRCTSKDRRNLTVLVVDDEAGIREFAVEALGELGFDVLAAETADRALQILTEGAGVDILLTDVVMPGRSGRQLADDVKQQFPDIRTLYMTGYTRNAIVHNGTLDPGTHLITKPFSINQLELELDALLA